MLFLGLDACDPGIMRALAARGEAPAFSSLLARAASWETAAPTGLFVGATWPTIATGRRADHHGYYTWLEVEDGS